MSEIICLNKGMPSDDICGRNLFEMCLQELANAPHISTFSMLNYGDDCGPMSAREALCSFLNSTHAEVASGEYDGFDPKLTFLTSGNSHAMSCLCTLLLHSSKGASTVLCDDPTYPFAKMIFKDHGAVLCGVPLDKNKQTNVEQMRRECEIARAHHRPVKFVYVVPSFHNPTGGVMPLKTRQELVQLAHEFDFFLLCDDVYQLLHFSSKEPAPACVVLFEQKVEPDKCRVVSLGTFSKIFAPSMRSGWIYTHNTKLLNRLELYGEHQSGGGFSAFSLRVGEQMIRTGRQLELLKLIRSRLEFKCKRMSEIIQSTIGEYVSFEEPSGGYFIWIELNDRCKLNAEELLKHCLELKPVAVKFFAGDFFSCGKRFPRHFRVSFALYDCADFEKAFQLIAQVIKSQ